MGYQRDSRLMHRPCTIKLLVSVCAGMRCCRGCTCNACIQTKKNNAEEHSCILASARKQARYLPGSCTCDDALDYAALIRSGRSRVPQAIPFTRKNAKHRFSRVALHSSTKAVIPPTIRTEPVLHGCDLNPFLNHSRLHALQVLEHNIQHPLTCRAIRELTSRVSECYTAVGVPVRKLIPMRLQRSCSAERATAAPGFPGAPEAADDRRFPQWTLRNDPELEREVWCTAHKT